MQLYTKWYTSKVREVNKLRNIAPTPPSDTTYYSMGINITGSNTLFYTTTILHIMASISSPSFHVPKKPKTRQLILINMQWPYSLGCNQLWQGKKTVHQQSLHGCVVVKIISKKWSNWKLNAHKMTRIVKTCSELTPDITHGWIQLEKIPKKKKSDTENMHCSFFHWCSVNPHIVTVTSRNHMHIGTVTSRNHKARHTSITVTTRNNTARQTVINTNNWPCCSWWSRRSPSSACAADSRSTRIGTWRWPGLGRRFSSGRAWGCAL